MAEPPPLTGRTVEWGGASAWYAPHELELMAALREAHERGEIPPAELRAQVDAIHALKAEFDARVLSPREQGPG